ncbi:hypothetical protein Ancab_040174 [Ancistrocladus abbreviatus]
MLMGGENWSFLFFTVLCIYSYSTAIMVVVGQPAFPSTANAPMSWKNDGKNLYRPLNSSCNIKPILVANPSSESVLYTDLNSTFGFGFFSNNTATFTLAVFIFSYTDSSPTNWTNPVVVWCANRDRPVSIEATLNLTTNGDLELRDADGSLVWFTNTTRGGRSVTSMHLSREGNLLLLNDKDVIWQSFEHPTDTWVSQQNLTLGQRLTSSVSRSNFSEGMFHVSVSSGGLHGIVDLNPAVTYNAFSWNYSSFRWPICPHAKDRLYFYLPVPGMATFLYGDVTFRLKFAYLRLESDGHLIAYRYDTVEHFHCDVITASSGYGSCAYPTVCGSYAICSSDGCSCPQGMDRNLSYFRESSALQPQLGCVAIDPLSCTDSNAHQTFLDLKNVSYPEFTPTLFNTDIDDCKRACLDNCSCKAAIFRFHENISSGNCSLPTRLLSLLAIKPEVSSYNATALIKVQRQKKSSLIEKLLLSIFGVFLCILVTTGACYFLQLRRKRSHEKEIDCSSDLVVSTLTRFPFETLRIATQDFLIKLGQGGFGSVFEGTLEDGTKVAVKRLDSGGQGRKEFLAEVNTIGGIHHFNLVRLIGFCDEKMNRLLVYEYMCNGSLDKWIFNQQLSQALNWEKRRSIIHGIGEGLRYLHEHCNQNVIHFDIKPQNILLDEDFNAKISDFGLAKMVDRDQSQVMTIVRGSPGYMAPELITGRAISVKVDVYSFGVLVLETVCGRKNLDSLQGDCLTNLVKMKADEDKLLDLIDECNEDIQLHKEEAMNVLKIAIWCLQPHFIRPTMSMVVKVLLGPQDMETLTDLSYLSLAVEANTSGVNPVDSSCPEDSLLSGPR